MALTAPSPWIVSPRYDAAFFLLSPSVSLAFWLGYALLSRDPATAIATNPSFWLPWIFAALLDQPHIFQTFSRTHGERGAGAVRPYTLTVVALVAAGWAIYGLGWGEPFLVALAVFGAWHIYRQNGGFLRLYEDRGVRAGFGRWAAGRSLFTGVSLAAIASYFLRPFAPAVADTLTISSGIAILVAAGQLLWAWAKGDPALRPSGPQAAFTLIVMVMTWLVYCVARLPIPVLTAVETAYHDIQYQGWVQHYQRRVGGQRVAAWLRWALLYGLAWGALVLLSVDDERWAWALWPFTMVVFYHYLVDGWIWQRRRDPRLAAL